MNCSQNWIAWKQLLSANRYLTGEYLTEADIRLFTTLIRFDAVYYGHFKCNLRRIADYPNLSNWLREIYQWPGIAETVDFTHIKHHYYGSHKTINPTGIVPKGPQQDFTTAHAGAAERERGLAQGLKFLHPWKALMASRLTAQGICIVPSSVWERA